MPMAYVPEKKYPILVPENWYQNLAPVSGTYAMDITVGRIVSVELRHQAKFCGDHSNRCRDISFLDFSRWRPPPS